MELQRRGPLVFRTEIEQWSQKVPFRIAGYTFESFEVLVVSLERDGLVGRGEAFGVYYRAENARMLQKQVEQVRESIERGISRSALQQLLPAGGARNAVD